MPREICPLCNQHRSICACWDEDNLPGTDLIPSEEPASCFFCPTIITSKQDMVIHTCRAGERITCLLCAPFGEQWARGPLHYHLWPNTEGVSAQPDRLQAAQDDAIAEALLIGDGEEGFPANEIDDRWEG
jgi:hypothetical protein